jgi:hypothetical protein
VAEVPIAILLRYILGEGAHDRSNLIVEKCREREKGTIWYDDIEVRNTGDRVAELCQASLTLKKVTKEDLVEAPKLRTLMNKKNFRPIDDVRMPCANSKVKEPDIRPDGREFFDFVREVWESDVGPSHLLRLEIPSESGWETLLCALKPKSYRGSVKIGAMNGKPARARVSIRYNRKKDELGVRVIPIRGIF